MDKPFPFTIADLQHLSGIALYPDSLVIREGAALWLADLGQEKVFAIVAPPEHPFLSRFHGEHQEFKDGYTLKLCPPDHVNGQALRTVLPWLQPVPLGLATSAGFGDRLGLATPGHLRALQRVLQEPSRRTIVPIFAQQSIREMQRTGRTPEEVLNDATWGAFLGGWRDPLGADADHLKTKEDVDICAAAGFTFFTIDPGDYVDSTADRADPSAIRHKIEALPWEVLEGSPKDLETRYVGRAFELEGRTITLDRGAVLRAAAKYGRAIAHVVLLARHLAAKGIPFELEISVDETATPTSHEEHIYIASELRRLGVHWVSLAPRFPGRFEKGIDYIGDLEALAESLAGHAAIARALGPYKLSLHSGSDKFSVYPLIVEATHGLVHLKTAGTSYLEALRVVAQIDPPLFRQISAYARERYPEDRATYHVSAELARFPDPEALPRERLVDLLDDRDARQILHVTFGSVMARFGEALLAVLRGHEEVYYEALERHFYRHLKPFVQ